MAFKNDVADDMALVRHSVWPHRAPRLARWAPRLAPVQPSSGTLSSPSSSTRWAPRLALVWPLSSTPSGTPSGLIFYLFLFWQFPTGKERKKCSVLVLNPQDPQVPQIPQASQIKLLEEEEEGFYGLVPLVPSSIPPLGGLTPKFLSLSFHSL